MYALMREHNYVAINAILMNKDRFMNRNGLLLCNIRREGIAV